MAEKPVHVSVCERWNGLNIEEKAHGDSRCFNTNAIKNVLLYVLLFL